RGQEKDRGLGQPGAVSIDEHRKDKEPLNTTKEVALRRSVQNFFVINLSPYLWRGEVLMKYYLRFFLGAVLLVQTAQVQGQDAAVVSLPEGVRAVWDMNKAFHETTPTRERICINGLWRWMPAKEPGGAVPDGGWGYFK